MTNGRHITCGDCQSRLEEFALDELTGEVRDRISQHLKTGCAACNDRLGEVLSEFAAIVYSLPTERPTMRVDRALRNRMEAQRMREEVARPGESLAPAATTRKPHTRRLIAVALTLAATVLGIAAWTAYQDSMMQRTAIDRSWSDLRRRIEQADESQHFSSIPQIQFASLGKQAPKTPVVGYVVEDKILRQWHVYALHLPELQPGHTYQLWFDMGNSRFVHAGTEEVDAEGTAQRLIDLPAGLGNVEGIVISQESKLDTVQPSGEIVVEAKLQH